MENIDKRKIWLVEDDRASRKMLVHYLSKKIGNYQIEEFEYAEDALKKIQQEGQIPDLIIFDNILKGNLTGIDATEQIKKTSIIPILVYSATPSTELLNRCIELEMVRYLSKPINPIELDFHIRALLREHKIKNQLNNLNLKYFALFNESKDMIFISSPEGKFLDINPSGIKMLGYSNKEELYKLDVQEDVYSKPEERERFKKEMNEHEYVKNFQTIMKKKDGSQIVVTISSSVIFKNNDNPQGLYIGIVRDITKQIENEKDLIKMNIEQVKINEELKKAQLFLVQQEKMASLGGLAAGLAHEINNPLGFVMSNFRTLKKYIQNMKDHITSIENIVTDTDMKEKIKSNDNIDFIMEDLDELFEESTDGFDRIASIVENMRQFARVDSENNRTFVNLNDMIKNTLVIAKNTYKYVADIITEFSNIPDISCNRSEINQVLLNIIVNASQAIEQEKKGKKGIIKIKTYVENDMICCSIEDNGPGIPEDYLNKVFDPFFTTKEVGKGTGMGLSISYDIIVNKHKGNLSVISDKNSGTMFLLKFKLTTDINGSEQT